LRGAPSGESPLIGGWHSATLSRLPHAQRFAACLATSPKLASLIHARRQYLDRILNSDLLKLQTQYGPRLVGEAVALADRMVERDALSVSGAKAKQREQRQDARMAQAVFRRKD
jgi:hypothetical protein